MAWIYVQATGALLHGGTLVATGYAGHGAGLDNPADEAVPGLGPLPAGQYTIGPPFTHPRCGPVSMRLAPSAGTREFGRFGFLMHGDNAALNHTASDGCIVLPRSAREQVAASADRELVVVSTPSEIPG